MVEFLPGAPAALIESVTGEVYNVEGVHDRGCVWELVSGCAPRPGKSIHRYDLDVLAPGVRLGGESQVWKTYLSALGSDPGAGRGRDGLVWEPSSR